MPSWTRICALYGRAHGLPDSAIRILDAFAPHSCVQELPPCVDFQALLGIADEAAAHLPHDIAEVLAMEVDQDQAAMFGRRFQAVFRILSALSESHPPARLFRVGLSCRTRETIHAPGPRALRVRAVIDYYYSQAAVLHHTPPGAQALPRPEEVARQARWEPLLPGLELAPLRGLTIRGPLHAHALRVRGLRFQARDARGAGPRVPFPDFVRSTGAIVGLSGGFFLYSEPDIALPSRRTDPVGLLVHEGEVVAPPVFRRATLFQDDAGRRWMRPMGSEGLEVLGPNGAVLRVDAHNRPEDLPRARVAFNRAFGEVGPDHPGWSLAVSGRQVVAVGRGSQPIPLAGLVIALPGAPPAGMEPGAALRYRLPPGPGGLPVREAMAGGPMLVSGGVASYDPVSEDFRGSAPPITFSHDETLGRNLLPRMAAGITGEGSLLFLAVDGRNFERAPGVTLQDLGQMMLALGAVDAMNLNGGGSKRMVVEGETLDIPSTEVELGGPGKGERIRPVHSAILLFPP